MRAGCGGADPCSGWPRSAPAASSSHPQNPRPPARRLRLRRPAPRPLPPRARVDDLGRPDVHRGVFRGPALLGSPAAGHTGRPAARGGPRPPRRARHRSPARRAGLLPQCLRARPVARPRPQRVLGPSGHPRPAGRPAPRGVHPQPWVDLQGGPVRHVGRRVPGARITIANLRTGLRRRRCRSTTSSRCTRRGCPARNGGPRPSDSSSPRTSPLPGWRAVAGSVNFGKAYRGADSWTPPAPALRCRFATAYVVVKVKYDLTVTAAERASLSTMLATCRA